MLARAPEESGRIGQRRTPIEAQIDRVFVRADVGIVLGHFFWPDAIAGNFLLSPDGFNDTRVE